MYGPDHTFFLVFEQALHTLRHEHQVYGAQHTGLIENIAAVFAQDKSVGRGAGGWCLASRKTVAPEMDALFVADRSSNPKTLD